MVRNGSEGLNSLVRTSVVNGNEISTANTVSIGTSFYEGIFRWNGSSWMRLSPHGFDGGISRVVLFKEEPYVVGDFTRVMRDSGGWIKANRIASMERQRVVDFMSGLDGSVGPRLLSLRLTILHVACMTIPLRFGSAICSFSCK